MTKIRLQNICLRNFKGTRYLLLNLDGKNTNISGANGTGKTTVYKAYYWCLSGKTLEPNENVQTLNENNEVIHKIETSVSMTLRIDDSYDMTLERRLVEKWKALGQPSEELRGTEQQRFINSVPLSAKEFDAKLAALCDIDKLLLLSDITKFMMLKTDERRKILLTVAGEVDEAKLAAPYPLLRQARQDNKTIDELKKQSLSTKKRASEELKSIPRQIAAQDKLKSAEDFDSLRNEKDTLTTRLADIDTQLKGSSEELKTVSEYKERIKEMEKKVENRKVEWNKECRAKEIKLKEELTSASKEYDSIARRAKENAAENEQRIAKKIKLAEEFQSKRTEWMEVNEKNYSETEEQVCPYCGRPLTEEDKAENRRKNIERFNTEKSQKLDSLLKESERLNEQIVALTASINEYLVIIKPRDNNAVENAQNTLNALKDQLEALQVMTIAEDNTYKELSAALENAKKESPKSEMNDTHELEETKRQLSQRRDIVIKLLAGEEQNKKIEAEKENLNKRSEELAQIIANCDNALYQIQEYSRAKVEAVEDKVNSLFSIAQWRFFEKNVSNDDLQEVCVCHHNGVDYNSTNGADRINLGIDIVSGIGKALDIDTPIFVDCAECVGSILHTRNQTITLEHVKDAPFTFTNF